MSALGSLFTEDFTSLLCIDLYETDGLLLFSSKSIIFQTTDLERVIEKAENIFNFYLDFNWEFVFIGVAYAPSVREDCRGCFFSLGPEIVRAAEQLCRGTHPRRDTPPHTLPFRCFQSSFRTGR